MKERLTAAGMDRRTVLKVAAAASAGVVAAGAINYGDAAASPLTGRKRLRYAKPQEGAPDADQTFYHTGIYEDPTSFDWNLNLYCNAEEETFAGVLTFNENLEAVADWAETFSPNEDASVWTFNIRKDNKGWTDGTPVTAHDFVWSWRRQLDPASKAAYAGFLYDIKYAQAFNGGTEYAAEGGRTGDPLGGQGPDRRGPRCPGDRRLDPRGHHGGPAGVLPAGRGLPGRRSGPAVEGRGARATPGRWPRTGSRSSPTARSRSTSGPRARCFGCRSTTGYWDAENIRLTNVIEPISPLDQRGHSLRGGPGRPTGRLGGPPRGAVRGVHGRPREGGPRSTPTSTTAFG
jgi:hypothetical protein